MRPKAPIRKARKTRQPRRISGARINGTTIRCCRRMSKGGGRLSGRAPPNKLIWSEFESDGEEKNVFQIISDDLFLKKSNLSDDEFDKFF